MPVACALALMTAIPLAAKPRTIENADLKYSVTVPTECRVEEGPGTLEAICSTDLDEAKSVELPVATALLLEVDAERVPADAAAYGEAEFRREAPEAVCGESDSIKVKLTDVKVGKDGGTATFTATITCPEIKFLGLGERQAKVQYLIAPSMRYRLMGRSMSTDAAAARATIDSFLQSFKMSAERKS